MRPRTLLDDLIFGARTASLWNKSCHDRGGPQQGANEETQHA